VREVLAAGGIGAISPSEFAGQNGGDEFAGKTGGGGGGEGGAGVGGEEEVERMVGWLQALQVNRLLATRN